MKLGFFLILCLCAWPSLAQQSGPEQGEADNPQSTQTDLPQANAPRSLLLGPYLPADALKPQTATPPLADETDAPTDGQVLDRLGAAGIGTFQPGERLPVDMWARSSSAIVSGLLARLPGLSVSPTARSLQRDLLLSPARDPFDGAIPNGLTLRLAALIRAGEADAAVALSSLIARTDLTGELARQRTEALIAHGRLSDACAMARTILRSQGGIFWLRLVAVCGAIDGQAAQSDLQLGLLRETGDDGPLLPALIEALLAGEAPQDWDGLAESFALVDRPDWALEAAFYALNVVPPLSYSLRVPPMMMQAHLRRAGLPEPDRVALAETALQLGLVDGALLSEILFAVSFSEPELASADLVLEDRAAIAGLGYGTLPLTGLMVDALLLQRAAQTQDAAMRMGFMAILWERARQSSHALPMARVLGPLIALIEPAPALSGYAPVAVPILYAAAEPDLAIAWFALMEADTEAYARAWPLVILSERGLDPTLIAGPVAAWAVRDDINDQDRDLVLVLMEALGLPMPVSAWAEALSSSPLTNRHTPPVAVWRQLLIAQADKRPGEVVAASLAALGSRALRETDPAALSAALGALGAVGLYDQARALALEVLIARP